MVCVRERATVGLTKGEIRGTIMIPHFVIRAASQTERKINISSTLIEGR